MTATSGKLPAALPIDAEKTKTAFGGAGKRSEGPHLAEGSRYGLANAALTRPASEGHKLCKYDMPIC